VMIAIVDELQFDATRRDVALGQRRMIEIARRLAGRHLDVVLLAQGLEKILVAMLQMRPQIGRIAVIGQHLMAFDAYHILLGNYLVIIVRWKAKIAPINAFHFGRIELGEIKLRDILVFGLNNHWRWGYFVVHFLIITLLIDI